MRLPRFARNDRKPELIRGSLGDYELQASPKGDTVAVKEIDMLGKEVILTETV